MNTFSKPLIALALIFTVAFSQAQPPPVTAPPNPVDPAVITELVGNWKNGLNSILHIKSIDAATGKIEGSYISPQGGGGGTAYPLIGWVNSAPSPNSKFPVVVISWSVRWGQIGRIAAWNGFYAALPQSGTPKTPTIVGNWTLSKPEGDYEWDHVLTGQDRFLKLP
jgi:hypothetical protein